jgi:hypothetical protein
LKLVATAASYSGFTGGIYTSADGGATWTTNDVTGSLWVGVASSADGSRLVAVEGAYGGGGFDPSDGIWISTNAGGNWAQTIAPVAEWHGVASSADGTKLAACSIGYLYFSTNSGSTWTTPGGPSGDYDFIASSADGNIVVAVDDFGGVIDIKQFTPTPVLNIATANSNLILSWIVPSISLVLQENADLDTTNWNDVEYSLALTNLQHQKIISPATSKMFFRLMSE